MPPTKTKETQCSRTTPVGPLGSTCNPKPNSRRTIKLETQEATIPSQNSSVPHSVPAINKPSISKPRSKAYYAIKSKPQEDRSPSPKAPVPHITLAAREELWVIWKSDPRVPTIASRHAWAVSRNVSPIRVDQWFCSRKSLAKRSGQPISNDTYELSLEPRVVPVGLEVKRELLSPSPSFSDRTDINSPSNDTLVSFDARGSDASYMAVRSSVPAPSMTPEPTQGNLYLFHGAPGSSPVSRTLTPGTNDEQDGKDLYSLAPRFSIYDDSSTDHIPNSEDKVCSQGDSSISHFTCTLCKPLEGDLPLVAHLSATDVLIHYLYTNLRELDYPEIALDKLVQKSIFPLDTSLTTLPVYARLDPGPDTLMELSAIPYLFCSPSLAFAPTPSGFSASWMEGRTHRWTY